MHPDSHAAEAVCCPKPKRRFASKSFFLAASVALLVIASYVWPALQPFRVSLWHYTRLVGPYMVLGLLIGGVIDRFIPQEYVSRALARKKKRTIFYSVLLGLILSSCSHGVLALAMELRRKGASTPVMVSFLLASPWTNLPIAIILFGLFGLERALFIMVSALGVAFITGLVFQWLEKRGWVESNPKTLALEEGFSILQDFKRRIRSFRPGMARIADDIRRVFHGSVALGRMTLFWITLGIVLSSLAGAFIPSHFFHQYMGASVRGLLTTLGLATVIEVCSEGTAPLAFELFKQTGALGNAFVFLMAGVATDYTEIGLLWSNVGRKTALWMPVVALPQIIAFGILANRLF